MLISRLFIIFLYLLIPPTVFGNPPDINEIFLNVKKEYKGLKSFYMHVDFINVHGPQILYDYFQKGQDVKVLWSTSRNETRENLLYGYIKNGKIIEDVPIIPLTLQDFTNPEIVLYLMNLEKNKISYEYVDHIPCVVMGNTNKIYVDIENFVIRKKIIEGKEYLFKDFVHIGNYFLPHKIEIKCGEERYIGQIVWKKINREEEIHYTSPVKKRIGGIKSDENTPPILKCLPMATSSFGFR